MTPLRKSVRTSSSVEIPTNSESNVIVNESVHLQSIWWRNVPLIYDRFVCTPLPHYSNICIALPSPPITQTTSKHLEVTTRATKCTINPLYYRGVFDRVRRLSSGQLTTHPSPPIDILVNSEFEIFIVRLELPLDPPRISSSTTPHDEKRLCQNYALGHNTRAGEAHGGLRVGDFISHQKANQSLPSSLGGAELIDIPNVMTGHLVRRTIGIPIAHATSVDLWVAPSQHKPKPPDAMTCCDSGCLQQNRSDNSIWRSLVAVKTDGGPIYVFDPSVMLSPHPPKNKTTTVQERTSVGPNDGKNPACPSSDMEGEKNYEGCSRMKAPDRQSELLKRRSSLTDDDLLEAAVLGRPLEFPLFDDDIMHEFERGKTKREENNTDGGTTTTSINGKEGGQRRTSEKRKNPIRSDGHDHPSDDDPQLFPSFSKSKTIMGHHRFKQHEFTLILNGLNGTGGQVIWGRTGGGGHCISTYVIGCNDEGQIAIWDVSCNFLIDGKTKENETFRCPLYLVSNAHSGQSVNSIAWAGSLHPDYMTLEQLNRADHDSYEDPYSVADNQSTRKRQREVSSIAISFLSVGHDGALKLWYSQRRETERPNQTKAHEDESKQTKPISTIPSKETRRKCSPRFPLSQNVDFSCQSDIYKLITRFSRIQPAITHREPTPLSSDKEGCARIGCLFAANASSLSTGSTSSFEMSVTEEPVASPEGDIITASRDVMEDRSGEDQDTTVTSRGNVKQYQRSRQPTKGDTATSRFMDFDNNYSDEIGLLLYRSYYLESIPITSVAPCPNSLVFLLTGDWNGNICRWAMSQLKSDLNPDSDSFNSFLSPQLTTGFKKLTRTNDLFLQSPDAYFHYHTGPILKLKCLPTLPMLFFSVGLDRTIGFWDMTKQLQDDAKQVDENDEDDNEYLLGLHGGHKLISSFPSDVQQMNINLNDQQHCSQTDQKGVSIPLSMGGVINDCNWLSYSLPDPLRVPLSLMVTENPSLGLTAGGSTFSTALFSGVSIDDNNLLQIWALSDDHFVTPEDNLPGRTLLEDK